MQVLPHVYLVNGFPYGQHQNGYLVRAGGVTLLVDSGDLETDTFELVRANAALWGLTLEDVDYLLVTHAHFDHASHAARLQRAGAKVVANADAAAAMAAGDERCIGYAVHRTFEPCTVDMVVSDGQELALGDLRVRCLWAPGHAQSCTVYELILDGRVLWFVGDVIIIEEECRGARPGWNGGPDYDRATYLETLRRLARGRCDVLLAGHGPPCLRDGWRLVEAAYTRALTTWR
ncbi:MAG: MBL fold metallo-hydrolase [Chloroflexota bacterium]